MSAKLRQILDRIPFLIAHAEAPRGIVDEGRIFALGSIATDEHDFERVIDVVQSLGGHLGQPFDLHPWAYTFDVISSKMDGKRARGTTVGIVWPNAEGTVTVRDYLVVPRGLIPVMRFVFHHSAKGTVAREAQGLGPFKDSVPTSQYPTAIAMLNTRGCQIDLVRAPSLQNERLRKLGKPPVPAHYNVDAREYFTALRAQKPSTKGSGTHASPIPHLRRAHERILANGSRTWIRSALINVRREGDIAFVERRKSYVRDKPRRPEPNLSDSTGTEMPSGDG